ncbi:MAG: TonB-dependent receptor plug domain-containing protein, partial [bacterium]|nr:TonB-dependent receptor plug domain-containing protein [bacterium]
MRNKLLISFLLSLLILMPLSLRSQETEIFADETLDNIYDMSIDELMNISVSVASKKDEKVKDAPGTVTVYNASLIRQLGYYTIKDLANITPGYSAMKTADVEYQLETRGTTASNNEKNLVLIDGMPVNHARNNKALCQEEIPLLFAQRVEFLRGPASALYGMGAFNGVINIIPKRLEEDGTQIETDFTVGLDESLTNDDGTVLFRKRFMANVLYKSGSVNFICSASYIANEASLETFNGQNYNKYRDNQEATFVYAKQTFDFGLGLGVLYMDRTNGYGTGWAAGSAEIDKPNKANFHRWQSVISFLQYKANLSNTIKLNSSAKFNIAREAGLQANKDWWNDYDLTDLDYAQMNGYLGVFNFDVTTNNLEALAEVSWDIFDSLGFIVGINYDIRWQQKSKAWTIESQTNTDYTQLYSK